MHIEKKDFIKILDFLNLNGLNIDKNFLPKPIGRGQANPTFVIQDNKVFMKELFTKIVDQRTDHCKLLLSNLIMLLLYEKLDTNSFLSTPSSIMLCNVEYKRC